jgi:hypothetical protein
MSNEVEELMHDFLKSINEYIGETVPKLDLLVNEFYLGCNQDTWKHIDDLLEGLETISKMFSLLRRNHEKYSDIDKFTNLESNFSEIIKNFAYALENGDRTYIIDIIIYEIKEIFLEISKEIASVLEENTSNAK